MTKYFNFERLINKYCCSFTLLCAGAEEYDDMGERVTSITEETKTGAIIGISENKIYRSDGTLTAKDKELFMTESIGSIDKAYIIYEGDKYKVESNPNNNNQFTGVWQYILKWVSAFKGGGNNA